MRHDAATVHEGLRVAVYHVERTPYRRLHAEIAHAHWAISHVAEGDVRTVVRGQTFPVPRGSVMIHPPGLPYAEYAEDAGTHEWVIFEARDADGLDLFQTHPLPPVVKLRASAAWSGRFAELLAAWRGDDPWRARRVFTLTAELLHTLLEDWRQTGATPRPDGVRAARERFGHLIVWMSERLHLPLTRTDLARAAHLHANYFDRTFRAVHGIAPMTMLRQMRLQRGRHLLETTDDTVETVAAACGFADACQFTRAFRRTHGEPPGRYRQGVKSARNRYARL